MMTRKDELEATIRAAQQELDEIENQEGDEARLLLLDKCYKRRSSYSCPDLGEYWWLYYKITGVNGRRLSIFSFEKDIAGQISICPDSNWWRIKEEEEVIPEEFDEAWDRLREEITEL